MWVCVVREQDDLLYEHLTRPSHDAVQPSTNSNDPVAWHLAWPFHPALPTLALTLTNTQRSDLVSDCEASSSQKCM